MTNNSSCILFKFRCSDSSNKRFENFIKNNETFFKNNNINVNTNREQRIKLFIEVVSFIEKNKEENPNASFKVKPWQILLPGEKGRPGKGLKNDSPSSDSESGSESGSESASESGSISSSSSSSSFNIQSLTPIDWSKNIKQDSNGNPIILNQGDCDCCTKFSCCSACAIVYNIDNSKQLLFSPQSLIDCNNYIFNNLNSKCPSVGDCGASIPGCCTATLYNGLYLTGNSKTKCTTNSRINKKNNISNPCPNKNAELGGHIELPDSSSETTGQYYSGNNNIYLSSCGDECYSNSENPSPSTCSPVDSNNQSLIIPNTVVKSFEYYKNSSNVNDSNYLGSGDDAVKIMYNLLQRGPLMAAVDASQKTFESYQNGVVQSPDSDNNADHAIVIVGYGVENGIPFWNILNSWGSSYGNNGFIKIEAGKNVCAIETQVAGNIILE